MMHRPVLLVACLLACSTFGMSFASSSPSPSLLKRPYLADMPLNRWPMVGSHDAATGYLRPKSLSDIFVFAWTKTQEGSITDQLNCGARYFDWRPKLTEVDGKTQLVFHHGPVTVPYSMEAAAKEVVDWANSRAANEDAEDDLVVIRKWACAGEAGCSDEAVKAFERAGLPQLHNPHCTNMTLQEVMEASALPGGGHAVVMVECSEVPWDTYDDRLSCNGFTDTEEGRKWEKEVSQCIDLHLGGENKDWSKWSDVLEAVQAKSRNANNNFRTAEMQLGIDWSRIIACLKGVKGVLDSNEHYSCYPDGQKREQPWQALHDFNEKIWSKDLPVNPNYIVSLQGAWAENTGSVALGFLHGSSLLKDEERSQLNHELIKWVTDMPHAPSVIGINNVCNGGNELLAAMRAKMEESL